MTHDGIEPLEPKTWLAQLTKLATRPKEGEALASSLRLAFHLTQLTPGPLRHLIRCIVSEHEFEALLESESFAEAALALLGDRMGYTVSRPSGGTAVTAEVWLPGDEQGCRVTGSNAAPALFGAWLARLGSLDERAPAARRVSQPVRRRARSERRPKSTEH